MLMTFARQETTTSITAGSAGRKPRYSVILTLLFSVAAFQAVIAQQASQANIKVLIRQDHLQEAEQQIWSVLSADSSKLWALDLLGDIRIRQNRLDEAEALFRKSLATSPSDIHASRGIAETYRLGGKKEQAIDAYLAL